MKMNYEKTVNELMLAAFISAIIGITCAIIIAYSIHYDIVIGTALLRSIVMMSMYAYFGITMIAFIAVMVILVYQYVIYLKKRG